jgi:hypothetical protein
MPITSNSDEDWAAMMPTYALCTRHGEAGHVYDAREGCPHCRKASQSVLRYGLSNAIAAPITAERLYWRKAALLAVLAALIAFFACVLHSERQRLDAAVAKLERASR